MISLMKEKIEEEEIKILENLENKESLENLEKIITVRINLEEIIMVLINSVEIMAPISLDRIEVIKRIIKDLVK
jgi:hypothetical protein